MADTEATAGTGTDEVSTWTGATDKLREVVKWVAAAFGTLGALLIGTTPLSDISKAELGGEFVVAVIAGLGALACVGWVFWMSTSLLVPTPLELVELRADRYAGLRHRVQQEPEDYLGSYGRSFEEFVAIRARDRQLVAHLDAKYAVEADPTKRENLLKGRVQLLASVASGGLVRSRLLAWAEFQRLREDFEKARVKMFVAAVGAAIGITVFHVAASAAVPEKATNSDNDTTSAGALGRLR